MVASNGYFLTLTIVQTEMFLWWVGTGVDFAACELSDGNKYIVVLSIITTNPVHTRFLLMKRCAHNDTCFPPEEILAHKPPNTCIL